ncbi:MAG: LamG-like jellyroll fold domain-containing protein, partial [Limisphaerales bacterium]
TSWSGSNLSDGKWHQLTGTVNSKVGKVSLSIDGKVRDTAPWTADILDDRDETDLVIGADSGKKKYGHTYTGLIHGLRISPRLPTLQP